MERQDFKNDEEEASLVGILRKTIKEQVITPSFTAMEETTSIMIVDDTTMQLVNTCMKTQHLNEMGVGAIMDIDFYWETYEIPPIYFLSPSLDSVKALVANYADEFDTHNGKQIHVYFCGVLSQECVDIIKCSNLSDMMKNWREVNCDFLPLQEHLYSFERPTAIYDIWISQAPYAREIELQRCCENLVSVVRALDEDPYILFPKFSEVAGELAEMFEDLWSRNKGKMTANAGPVRERGTLIILDRSQDAAVPLMHDWSFEASNNNMSSFNTFDLINNCVEDKIDDCLVKSRKESHPKTRTSLPPSTPVHSDIRGALQEAQSNLLKEICEFEQAMTSRIHEVDGECVKTKRSELFETLKMFLDGMETDKMTKTRLLMIYLLSQGGHLGCEDLSIMLEKADLTEFQQQAVNNLSSLGYPLSAEAPAPKQMFEKLTMARAEELYDEMNMTEGRPLLLERFEPEVAHVLRMQLDEPERLSKHFAFQGEQPEIADGKRPKTIIFIVGGVTYSEARMAYSIGKQRGRDVFIGGTSIMTARQYMEAIAGMKEASEEEMDVAQLPYYEE